MYIITRMQPVSVLWYRYVIYKYSVSVDTHLVKNYFILKEEMIKWNMLTSFPSFPLNSAPSDQASSSSSRLPSHSSSSAPGSFSALHYCNPEPRMKALVSAASCHTKDPSVSPPAPRPHRVSSAPAPAPFLNTPVVHSLPLPRCIPA